MKIYPYIYTDNMIQDVDNSYTAENRNLFSEALITYDFVENKCYIHSDVEIVGLTLFKTNSTMIPSVRGG